MTELDDELDVLDVDELEKLRAWDDGNSSKIGAQVDGVGDFPSLVIDEDVVCEGRLSMFSGGAVDLAGMDVAGESLIFSVSDTTCSEVMCSELSVSLILLLLPWQTSAGRLIEMAVGQLTGCAVLW
jgi:hypothetical protein